MCAHYSLITAIWSAFMFRYSLRCPLGQRISITSAGRTAEAEVEAQVALRVKAGLAEHILPLPATTAFTVTVAPIALRFDLVPISFSFSQ